MKAIIHYSLAVEGHAVVHTAMILAPSWYNAFTKATDQLSESDRILRFTCQKD